MTVRIVIVALALVVGAFFMSSLEGCNPSSGDAITVALPDRAAELWSTNDLMLEVVVFITNCDGFAVWCGDTEVMVWASRGQCSHSARITRNFGPGSNDRMAEVVRRGNPLILRAVPRSGGGQTVRFVSARFYPRGDRQ